MKRKQYTGVLTEQVPWPADGKPVGREIVVINKALLERIEALLDHYDIEGGADEPGVGWKLAMALARNHVPGFQPMPKPSKSAHRPPDLLVGGRDLILFQEGLLAQVEGRSQRSAT